MAPARQRTRRALDTSPAPSTGGRVRVIKGNNPASADIQRAQRNISQQDSDPFASQTGYGAGTLQPLEPPFSLSFLRRLSRDNNMLGQCIDAMVTNVGGFGWRLEYVGDDGQEESPAALAEYERMMSLAESPNPEYSLSVARSRRRKDLETIGYGTFEITRDTKGLVTMIYHVPSHTIRMTRPDTEPTQVSVYQKRNGKEVKINYSRRFRRFVQMMGTRKVYFKEIGDPRIIDPKTGNENNALSVEAAATEILYSGLYSPGETYGLPRWLNQLPAVMGSREAELTNLDFFKDNAIPAMLITVAGGVVTDEAFDTIKDVFQQAAGREAVHRVVLLEADPSDEVKNMSVDKGGAPIPSIGIHPMQSAQQKDGLFLEYDRENGKKIRSSFRIHPMFVGLSDDLTHATAQASIVVSDAQVFGPERQQEDDLFNQHVFCDAEGRLPRYWRFRTNPPRIVNPDNMVEALDTFEQLGAMTPNIAIGIANEVFNLRIDQIEEDWGNVPFALTTATAAQPVAPGLEDDVADELPEDEAERQVSTSREVVELVTRRAKIKGSKKDARPRTRRR